MHSLTAATSKLNLDMVTQKHKFDSFMFNVSFDLRIQSVREVLLISVI